MRSFGGVCSLLKGANFLEVGPLGSARGDDTAAFGKHFWISIADTTRPELQGFFVANAVGKEVWVMKQNILSGPFTITSSNREDKCKTISEGGTGFCTDGAEAMFFLNLASDTKPQPNTEFKVGVRTINMIISDLSL